MLIAGKQTDSARFLNDFMFVSSAFFSVVTFRTSPGLSLLGFDNREMKTGKTGKLDHFPVWDFPVFGPGKNGKFIFLAKE